MSLLPENTKLAEAGQSVTNPIPEKILTALAGHAAKPFVVLNAENGMRISWWDDEEHAFQAARFLGRSGQCSVVYRAIGVVEPLAGTTAELTRDRTFGKIAAK